MPWRQDWRHRRIHWALAAPMSPYVRHFLPRIASDWPRFQSYQSFLFHCFFWLTFYSKLRVFNIRWFDILFVSLEYKFSQNLNIGWLLYLLKNGPIPATFCLFSFFSHSNSNNKYTIWTIQIEKSVDGVLGTQTQGGRIDGADKSTELWQNPYSIFFGGW